MDPTFSQGRSQGRREEKAVKGWILDVQPPGKGSKGGQDNPPAIRNETGPAHTTAIGRNMCTRVQMPGDLTRLFAWLGLMHESKRTHFHLIDHSTWKTKFLSAKSFTIMIAFQPDPVTAQGHPIKPLPVV